MTPTPYLHPSAWVNEDVSGTDDWIVQLDAHDIAEIDQALAHVKAADIQIPALAKSDFQVPRVAKKMATVLRMVEAGRGFALIRGLPMERYSKADAARIYWGLGAHLGPGAIGTVVVRR